MLEANDFVGVDQTAHHEKTRLHQLHQHQSLKPVLPLMELGI
jgi:hypothetical protein